MKLFDLTVMTAQKQLYHGKALSLIVPAALGSMGILADHMPLISTLKTGTVSITPPDYTGKIIFTSLGGGFIQIRQNKVTVILDSVQ